MCVSCGSQYRFTPECDIIIALLTHTLAQRESGAAGSFRTCWDQGGQSLKYWEQVPERWAKASYFALKKKDNRLGSPFILSVFVSFFYEFQLEFLIMELGFIYLNNSFYNQIFLVSWFHQVYGSPVPLTWPHSAGDLCMWGRSGGPVSRKVFINCTRMSAEKEEKSQPLAGRLGACLPHLCNLIKRWRNFKPSSFLGLAAGSAECFPGQEGRGHRTGDRGQNKYWNLQPLTRMTDEQQG